MATQKQWNEYEAVLLLDNYLKTLNHQLSRKEAIHKTSIELRDMAKTQGFSFDEIFRNENGITFQMHSMESAYRGYTILKPASKLFIAVNEMYRTNRNRYEILLREARSMVSKSGNNQDDFLAWLSNKVSSAQLSELYLTYRIIDDFCMKTNVLHRSILEETDINIIRRVQQTIEQNRIFKFKHKQEINKIKSAIQYYVTYSKDRFSDDGNNDEIIHTAPKLDKENLSLPMIRTEQDEVYSKTYPLIYKKIYEALKAAYDITGDKGVSVLAIYENIKRIGRCDAIKEILDNVSWSKCVNSKYVFSVSVVEKEKKQSSTRIYSVVMQGNQNNSQKSYSVSGNSSFAVSPKSSFEKQEEIRVIDFSNIGDLSYTKPVFASYFEEEIANIGSWTQLYLSLFKKLYEDYENVIPINQSFAQSNGRMDLCTRDNISNMVAPKEVAHNIYLETNLSSTDIIRKIKLLLDICLVDENNVLIKYDKKSSSNYTTNNMQTSRTKNTIASEAFFRWLKDDQQLAEPTCRSYVSAVNCSETFARDNNLVNRILYTSNLNEARATANELLRNKDFIELDLQQHHRYKAGLTKLLLYIGDGNTTASSVESTIDLQPYKEILNEKFSRGFRMNSPLELRKYKRFWCEAYGESPTVSDEVLSSYISMCGIIHEDKLYMPEKMLDDKIKSELLSYINSNFQSGKPIIYYEALFKEFSEVFLDHCMYNADMLKSYLIYLDDPTYFIGKKFISKEANVRVEPYDEVKRYLEEAAVPVGFDEMFEALSHIPQQKIRIILAQNDEFISNGRKEYFHISAVSLSSDELDDIADIINVSISEKQFISGNELLDSIKRKYPYIVEQNTMISEKGLRDAIGYKLRSRFSFRGNIISKKGQALSMMKVFADFCKQRGSFSLDELKVLKQELDTTIYFEAVYENSLRVSQDRFVSKENAAFLPDETDETIDRFCVGDYIALGKIKQFGSFPDAGFQWNSFLLEHYVSMYSPNYKLVHSNYNESVCVGGIVKKISDIDTFEELVTDVLARNGHPLNKDSALQYLCDEGYLARRSYSGIEQLLIKAQELRNQKGL